MKNVHNGTLFVICLIDVDRNDHFQVLHIPGLTEVLRLHPDFLEQFSEDIQHDLTYNLREGYDPEVPCLPKDKFVKVAINIFSALRLNSQFLIKSEATLTDPVETKQRQFL